jgi:hypothetical protein
MNKYAPTSLSDKVNLVLRLYSGRCSKNWMEVQKALTEILGENKKTTVSRHLRARMPASSQERGVAGAGSKTGCAHAVNVGSEHRRQVLKCHIDPPATAES